MEKFALVFPGQGSQYVGMGKDIYDSFDVARKVFREADDVLGFSITELSFNGPEEELKKTYNTQPALLTVSYAVYAVLKEELGDILSPFALAGHSLGEYTALVVGGALDFADAVRLVRKRGEFMQDAVPLGEGTMAAIMGLERQKVIEVCNEASSEGVVEPVNYNSPAQIVISGHTKAVEKAVELAKEAGAGKAVILPVSAPFHSSLMKPAAERLAEEINNTHFNDSRVPVVSNVSADYVTEAEKIRSLLVQQMYKPVLWEDSIVRLIKDGVNTFTEVGAGKVLKGLIKKIDRKTNIMNVGDMDTLKSALDFFRGGQ